MKRNVILSMTLLFALSSFSGCGIVSSLQNTDTADVGSAQADSNTTQSNTSMSTGYVLLDDGMDYVELYSAPTDGSVVARMYADEPLTVYSIDSDWANVSYGGMSGYVELQYVSFSKPQTKEDTSKKRD